MLDILMYIKTIHVEHCACNTTTAEMHFGREWVKDCNKIDDRRKRDAELEYCDF